MWGSLSQALLNLLDNAAKFTPSGGSVALEGRVQGAVLELSVSDTGVGIPPDKLPLIFEMFAQLDRSHERPYSGLGVGLSLAKRLVELHGGTLDAESGGPGRGSRFTMRLAVEPQPCVEGPNPVSSSEPLEGSKGMPGGSSP